MEEAKKQEDTKTYEKAKEASLTIRADDIFSVNNKNYKPKPTIFGIPVLWLYAHPNAAYTLMKLNVDINSSSSNSHPLTQEELNTNFIEVAKDDSYYLERPSILFFMSSHIESTKQVLAEEGKHFQKLSSLLAQGANINAQDYQKRTALHWAAKSGNLKKMQFLVNNEADISIRDNFEKTALDLTSDDEISKFLQETKTIENKRATVDVVNFLINNGTTNYSETIMRILMENGADTTALVTACRKVFKQ